MVLPVRIHRSDDEAGLLDFGSRSSRQATGLLSGAGYGVFEGMVHKLKAQRPRDDLQAAEPGSSAIAGYKPVDDSPESI